MMGAGRRRIVSIHRRMYTYEQMRRDVWMLWERYERRQMIGVQILGSSLEGRNIYAICLGNPRASKCVVVDAAMHGREWLNTQLMMVLAEELCIRYDRGSFQGKSYRELLDEVCIYVLPMVNPDGVSISQRGLVAVEDPGRHALVASLAAEGTKRWKANAGGVDLNRNFHYNFRKNPVTQPAAQEYGGTEPLSEPEARALASFIDEVKPLAVVNYHETGPLIYYSRFSKLLFGVRKATGYAIQREQRVAPGAFSSWLDMRGIDCCCVETCRGKAPVGHWQLLPAYYRNRQVLAAAAWACLS